MCKRQVWARERQPHGLLALQLIERDRAHVRRAASQGRAECRVVATRVVLGGDAERARERREDVPVRARLALRRDHPVRVLEVELTERAVEVGVLHRRRRRQHEVGVVGAIGHHLLVDDGEEIVAGEPAQHEHLIGAYRRRVRRVDVERLDRRRQRRIGQRAPELDHIDDARPRRRHQIRPLERAHVHRERATRGQQRAAVRVGVGAGQRRQAGERTARHPAVVVARDTDADADERARARAIATREGDDRRRVEADDGRDALGRPGLHVLGERLEAERRALDVVVVHEAVGEQHLHDGQGQRAVGAGPHREMLVRLQRRRRAIRIDDDDVRASLPRLLDERHHVDRGVRRVDAPQHDEVGADHLLGVVARDLAEGRAPAAVGCRHADRSVEPAGAERVEQRMPGKELDLPHRAGVRERQDRLAAVPRHDLAPASRDLRERVVPGDALEAALALGADATQRRQHAQR